MSQEQIHYFSSWFQDKIVERLKTLGQIVTEISSQVCEHMSLWWLISYLVVLEWAMCCKVCTP